MFGIEIWDYTTTSDEDDDMSRIVDEGNQENNDPTRTKDVFYRDRFGAVTRG